MSVVTKRSKSYYELMDHYEKNYARLIRLVPELRALESCSKVEIKTVPGLTLYMLEASKYTTTCTFIQNFGLPGIVPDMVIKIRVYHDARVVEVLSFQGHQRLLSKYPYPNPAMYHPYEKRDINLFLGEWLAACLNNLDLETVAPV